MEIDESSVRIKGFTGRSVYEALVFGYRDDGVSAFEVLHNFSCSGLVDIDSLYTSVVLILCKIAALESFVV